MSDTKQEWVERVLGVRLTAGSPGDFKMQWQKSYAAWLDAVEAVDKQMEALGTECRKTKDAWLVRIAELGLPAVTGNHKTKMMAACRDVSMAPDDKLPAAAAKARQEITGFAQHLASNPQVAGCDANPFGVPVSIRGTLGAALNSLNAALRQAAK